MSGVVSPARPVAGEARGVLLLLMAGLFLAVCRIPEPTRVKIDPLPPRALLRLGSTRLRHSNSINCIVFAPGGRLVASAGQDRLIYLWDVQTGRPVRRFSEHRHSVEALAFSAEGTVLASAGSNEGTIRLWHVASGRLLETIPANAPRSVLFSQDGRTLLVGESRGPARLWDRNERRWLTSLLPENCTVACTALSARGELLALTVKPTVALWNVASGALLCEYRRIDSPLDGMTLSPDGAVLSAGDREGVVSLWDARTGKVRCQIATGSSLFSKWTVNKDATQVIGVSNHHSIAVWDAAGGGPVRVMGDRLDSVEKLSLSPDGQTLAAVVGSLIYLWDLNSGRQLHPAPGRELLAAAMYPALDRHALVIEDADGSLRLCDWTTGQQRRCWRRTSSPPSLGWILGGLHSLALSPDGRLLAECVDEHTIRLRDARTNRQLRTLHTADQLWFLSFSPDSKILISHALEGTQLWSVPDGEEIKVKRIPLHILGVVLLSPDGRWLVSQPGNVIVGQPTDLVCWDRIAQRGWHVKDEQLRVHAFSPDGRMLAGTISDGRQLICLDDGCVLPTGTEIVLWETETGGERLRLPLSKKLIQALAFSPDGRTLAAGYADGAIQVWDVPSQQLRMTLSSDQGAIHALEFAADGTRLASVGATQNVLIWDVRRRAGEPQADKPALGQEPEVLWANLKERNAAHAFTAQQALARAPDTALVLLREWLHPVARLDAPRVQRLIADLDSDSFPVREEAMGRLEQLGDATECYLRQALLTKPSLELRRRVEHLLAGLAEDSPEHLRLGRALEVLEWLDAPEARQLLAELARGAPESWLTRRAQEAMGRVQRRRNRLGRANSILRRDEVVGRQRQQ